MNIFEEYKNNKITLFKTIENLDTHNYTVEEIKENEILNFLNSNLFFDSVVEIGTVKPGKEPYYSLTKQQLEEILR